MRAARSGRRLALATLSIASLAMFAISGCGEPEGVRVHDEVAPPKPDRPPIPESEKRYRTLAAMVPADDEDRGNGKSWWFFKLSGPVATVNKYQTDFDKLLESLISTTDEKSPILFTLPPGWTRENAPATGTRFATLKSPGGEVEISVTNFGGSVLTNVQRWWGQLWEGKNVQDFTPVMLAEAVQQRTVHGRLVLRVDLYGPTEPKSPKMMMNPHGGN